jgi:hypothetical protein
MRPHQPSRVPLAGWATRMTGMSEQSNRVPKAQRLRLHRLKNAYRKVYRREPELGHPDTEEAALQAIASLERELRQAEVPLRDENPKGVVQVPKHRQDHKGRRRDVR